MRWGSFNDVQVALVLRKITKLKWSLAHVCGWRALPKTRASYKLWNSVACRSLRATEAIFGSPYFRLRRGSATSLCGVYAPMGTQVEKPPGSLDPNYGSSFTLGSIKGEQIRVFRLSSFVQSFLSRALSSCRTRAKLRGQHEDEPGEQR